MKELEVVVIGGGISGLSFAYGSAAAGRETLVLEAAGRLGGCIHTQRLASGFWFELGAHTCYNSYGGFIEMLEGCGLLERLLPRAKVPFKMLRDGKLRSVFQELDLWELLRSAPRLFSARKEGQSVKGYYGRLVGQHNYERVLGPFLAAVPSQNADAFPATMLFKKRPRRKDVRRSFTLEGGMQTVVDAMAGRLKVAVDLAAAVVLVEREGQGFAVATQDGRRFRARSLAIAVPPPAAAELLREAFPELAAQLARIRMASVDTVGVVVAKQKLTLEPVAGIVPAAGDLFFSAVSRDTVPDPHCRGFAFHFRPGLPLDQRLRRVTEVLKVERNDLEGVAERSTLLPSPALGHEEIVREIDRLVAGTHLFVTGNYFAGLAIEDCVSRSREELARLGVLG